MKEIKDFEKLKKDQEDKARGELVQSGIDNLITFTLNNFAYRYLETEFSQNISVEFDGKSKYSVSSYETNPIAALKISDPVAKKGIIALAKRFASTKGIGLRVKYELLCDTSEIKSDSKGVLKCRSIINWNMDENFAPANDKETIRESSISFNDPLVLRNRLATVLEDLCQLF